MERRALIILVVTLLAIVGVFYFALPDDDGPRGPRSPVVFPPGVDVQGTEMVYMRAGTGGHVTIRAIRGLGRREANEARLEEVHVQIVDPEGHASDLFADSAVVPSAGKTLEMRGDVRAQTADGYRLRTTDVRLDYAAETAKTDSVVHVEGPGVYMRGVGATLEWGAHTFELHDKVEATIQMSQLPGDVQRAVRGAP